MQQKMKNRNATMQHATFCCRFSDWSWRFRWSLRFVTRGEEKKTKHVETADTTR